MTCKPALTEPVLTEAWTEACEGSAGQGESTGCNFDRGVPQYRGGRDIYYNQVLYL